MNIITLEEFKTEMGITWTDKDVQINLLITRVSNTIQKYIWYELEFNTYTEYFEWWKSCYFTLLPPKEWEDIVIVNRDDGTIYELDLIIYTQVILKSISNGWDNAVQIDYKFWYENIADIPQELKWVCISWVKNKLDINDKERSGQSDLTVKTEKIEEMSITYFSPKELESSWVATISDFDILEQFRIKSII